MLQQIQHTIFSGNSSNKIILKKVIVFKLCFVRLSDSCMPCILKRLLNFSYRSNRIQIRQRFYEFIAKVNRDNGILQPFLTGKISEGRKKIEIYKSK